MPFGRPNAKKMASIDCPSAGETMDAIRCVSIPTQESGTWNSAVYFFFPTAALAARSCFFFWSALLTLACFCEACF